ncbi:hypothetical protein COHA_007950 [Chlorella ohadii]|uniref:Queuine tRNA-ribosyltransferase accessory subunit 2 n=1 Tax=Chlorella ohadii TaxID=2649997 RepID=A0AAD5DL93_9CHLO|nr:hypothetical protein COHA_007950 [Chlorella ohadii]
MFAVSHRDGDARSGELSTPNGTIATPGLLVYTHRGGSMNLTPDMLEPLRAAGLQGLQLDVLQFLNQPTPGVLSGGGGGRKFLALDAPGTVLVATGRDPAIYEYTGAMRQATNEWASGAATVTPERYVEALAAVRPDVWVALSDDVPSDSRTDRAAKSVDRTAAWLGACLAAAQQQPGLAAAAAWAVVQGAQYQHERQRCAEAVAGQPGVSGYVLGGLGTGESPEQRQQIVQAVLQRLPAGAPRMLSSVGTPEEILEAVAQGIDLFDTAYLLDVTNGGYALAFPLSQEADEAEQQRRQQQQRGSAAEAAVGAAAVAAAAAAGVVGKRAADECGRDDSKINLWALAYRTDRRPLLPGCTCFACANHTRAYVHHLLQTHEMTGQVLLEVHNTHHYLRFFAEVRKAIAAGRFAAYRDWFLQRRQRWLVGEGGRQ